MSLTASESILSRWAALGELSTALAQGVACLEAQGLWGSSRALVVSAFVRDTDRPVLYLSPGTAERHRAAEDIRFFRDTLDSARVPVLEFPPAEPSSWHGRHRDHVAERALVCHALVTGGAIVVVTTPAALGAPILSPETFRARTLTLTVGASLERDGLLRALETAGYERVETVVEVGQWSLRGGIVDIFSPTHDRPARAEFFGDEVESLRLFDPTTQRSVETLGELTVLPLAGADADHALPAWLPGETLVVLDDPAPLEAPPEEAPSAVPLAQALDRFQRLELPLLQRGGGRVPRVAMGTGSVGGFPGRRKDLAAEIRSWRGEGFAVRLVVDDEAQAARCRGILQEHDLEPWPDATLWSAEGLGVVTGDCAAGFQLPALGLVLLAEQDVFGARRRRLRRPVFQRGAAIAAFTDLNPGDLVVHEAHGIGRYHGPRTMGAEGRNADFLLLEYAEGGRLYLPVERLDLISKYMGAPSGAARLDRMGGGAWQRIKESVRAAVRQMAEQLLRLYATRSVAERPPFSPDTPWQREFEAAFRFEETPDQERAIEDVKADLERPRPMDRLVAGDVGYGKTEVALRAAFKAVLDQRQVAILVPTTILALQHYNTFQERLKPYPVRVELLSRFRSEKEQKQILEDLALGKVDIVIGTHRLLQKDVVFLNLGLLIIDEEQRFGVVHKERLKQMRNEIDVLTMTATPIPRTLHMSLVNVRDMSVIETPPQERLPIRTAIREYDESLISEAILREIDRGGQVFFVHNRVHGIQVIAQKLQRLIPEARIAVGHGQMPEDQLERVMMDFSSGEYDVLVSTTIIENGIDITNANTIIVNNAALFGLAQLYQLRWRVGRGTHQAYAYFLYNKDTKLTPVQEKRLRVIFEATELGAGFRIAMKDLEIRGAGNLLGAEQSGFMNSVGFDLYCKLLAEAVEEIQGKRAEIGMPSVMVDLPLDAYLPDEYIGDRALKVKFYQRLANLNTPEQVEAMEAELNDRFGPPPQPTENLLAMVRLKVEASMFGYEAISAKDN